MNEPTRMIVAKTARYILLLTEFFFLRRSIPDGIHGYYRSNFSVVFPSRNFPLIALPARLIKSSLAKHFEIGNRETH